MSLRDHVTLIIGGVGGAKLAFGLYHVLSPDTLTIIVNTGDDFTHLGLYVCPDLDTVTYTLAGLSDPERGWGLHDDSLAAMSMVGRLGGPDWFNLGDSDLGTSLFRTELLRRNEPLSTIEELIARRLGIRCEIIPMTDDSVSTYVDTDIGVLPFQNYFVEYKWQPAVRKVSFRGAPSATPAPGVTEGINNSTLIIIGPSNPFLSIAPVLSIPAIREALESRFCPAICLSPIIGGASVKGPTAKMMQELGQAVSPLTVADFYSGLIDGIMLDQKDNAMCGQIEDEGLRAGVSNILMRTDRDKIDCAERLLTWAEEVFA